MEESTTSNSKLVGAMDKAPSALEELENILTNIETQAYNLYDRLNPVSMRENVPSDSSVSQAVPSGIHIHSLVSRAHSLRSFLDKTLKELQI